MSSFTYSGLSISNLAQFKLYLSKAYENIDYVSSDGSTTTIVFSTSMDEHRHSIDDTVLAYEDTTTNTHSKFTTQVGFSTSNTMFTSVFQFQYSGKIQEPSLQSLSCVSISDDNASYDMRLVDITNNNLVAQASFSNGQVENVSVSVDKDALPNESALLELQAKMMGDGIQFVRISSVSINYNE